MDEIAEDFEQSMRPSAGALVEEVMRYERSCGIRPEDSAVKDIVSAPSPESARKLLEIGRVRADWNRFVREMDLCTAHKLGPLSSVHVRSDTPHTLLELGLHDHPMHHTQKHTRNELHPQDGTCPPNGGNYHGVPLQTMRSLPELLEHPWAVWDERPGTSGIAVALSAVDWKGDPLVCFVNSEETCFDDGKPNNFIKTVFGPTGTDTRLTEARETGRLLYVDPIELNGFLDSGKLSERTKEKLVSSPGIHYAQAFTSKTIIHPTKKLVKPANKESDPYFEAQKAWDETRRQELRDVSGFRAQLSSWSRRQLPPGAAFTLCEQTPPALRGIGLPDLPVKLPRFQAAHELGLARTCEEHPTSSIEAVLGIPEALSKPIAAWDARPGSSDVFVAFALQNEQGDVLVARIAPDSVDRKSGKPANVIKNVHGVVRIDREIEEAMATGRLLYSDPPAADTLPLSRRPILPTIDGGPLIHSSLKSAGISRQDDPYLAAQEAWDAVHPRKAGRRTTAERLAAAEAGARSGIREGGRAWRAPRAEEDGWQQQGSGAR